MAAAAVTARQQHIQPDPAWLEKTGLDNQRAGRRDEAASGPSPESICTECPRRAFRRRSSPRDSATLAHRTSSLCAPGTPSPNNRTRRASPPQPEPGGTPASRLRPITMACEILHKALPRKRLDPARGTRLPRLPGTRALKLSSHANEFRSLPGPSEAIPRARRNRTGPGPRVRRSGSARPCPWSCCRSGAAPRRYRRQGRAACRCRG
jgi:hypothetical protein